MADLVAQGAERNDRWRRRLPAGQAEISLGRTTGSWAVPWDSCISRQHVQLLWDGHQLRVTRCEGAANPVFFAGRATDEFQVQLGQHFVIGDTTFRLVDHASAHVSLEVPHPDHQQTFAVAQLRKEPYRPGQREIEALRRLPEIVAGSDSDEELFARLASVLFMGIAEARAIAVIRGERSEGPHGNLKVIHWDRLDGHGEEFHPSESLVRTSLELEESVVHSWHAPISKSVGDEFSWATCTPLTGEETKGEVIYVAGVSSELTASSGLTDRLKFIELVGNTVSSLRDARRLQRQAAALAPFFSTPVRDAIAATDAESVLRPREADVAVLFCDLRGFSRRSEDSADNLLELLERVSAALGFVTSHILDTRGVIGDFHGDAVMGFWGWPLADDRRVMHACEAALAIRAEFARVAADSQHALHDFRVGMGLATGRAVAGRIGTKDQVKITAFGPVVNLAARLESISAQLGLATILDEPAARAAQELLLPAQAKLRAVGSIRPYGLISSQTLYELAPTEIAEQQQWESTAALRTEGLQTFRNGRWEEARQAFAQLPDNDPLRDFYLGYIERYRVPPKEAWDGVIRFNEK